MFFEGIDPSELGSRVAALPPRFWKGVLSIGGVQYRLDKKGLVAAVGMMADYVQSDDSPFFSFGGSVMKATETSERVSDLTSFPLHRVEAVQMDGYDAMPGVIVVIGGTKAGKSTYLMSDQLALDYIIRAGEPAEHFDNDPRVIHAETIEDMLVIAWVLAFAGRKVAIDSFRKMVYGLKGAAGEGGTKPELFNVLTDVSNFFSYTKNVAHVVVNPLVRKDVIVEVYTNAASSAVGAVLIVDRVVQAVDIRGSAGRIHSFEREADAQVTEDRKAPENQIEHSPGPDHGPMDTAGRVDDDQPDAGRRAPNVTL